MHLILRFCSDTVMLIYRPAVPCRYADPILDRLDPNRYIAYRLYRDSTQYVGGRHCRDLTKLNRDPARVLLVSADPDAYHLQPENAIKVKIVHLVGFCQ